MTQRESGHYWVRIVSQWQVAHWSQAWDDWRILGSDVPHSDTDFAEIDERRIVRKEG